MRHRLGALGPPEGNIRQIADARAAEPVGAPTYEVAVFPVLGNGKLDLRTLPSGRERWPGRLAERIEKMLAARKGRGYAPNLVTTGAGWF